MGRSRASDTRVGVACLGTTRGDSDTLSIVRRLLRLDRAVVVGSGWRVSLSYLMTPSWRLMRMVSKSTLAVMD